MTNKEAIQVLKDWDGYFIGHSSDDVNEALNMAIKALEQESMLDKIGAEILKLDDINPDYPMDRTIHISRNEVLQLIDKYRK